MRLHLSKPKGLHHYLTTTVARNNTTLPTTSKPLCSVAITIGFAAPIRIHKTENVGMNVIERGRPSSTKNCAGQRNCSRCMLCISRTPPQNMAPTLPQVSPGSNRASSPLRVVGMYRLIQKCDSAHKRAICEVENAGAVAR